MAVVTKRCGKGEDFETIAEWIESLGSDEYTDGDEAVLEIPLPDGLLTAALDFGEELSVAFKERLVALRECQGEKIWET